MAGVVEEHRRHIAFGLAFLGLCLILLGFGLVVQHQSDLEAGHAQVAPLSPEARLQLAQRLKYVLFFLLVLVLVFSISLFAFLRWSRHFRRTLLRRPHAPTDASDVWAMHRLPPEAEPGEPEPPSPPGPAEPEAS